MRDFRVLNAVLGAAQCIANQMRCNVGVQRLERQTDSEIGKTINESSNAKNMCECEICAEINSILMMQF